MNKAAVGLGARGLKYGAKKGGHIAAVEGTAALSAARKAGDWIDTKEAKAPASGMGSIRQGSRRRDSGIEGTSREGDCRRDSGIEDISREDVSRKDSDAEGISRERSSRKYNGVEGSMRLWRT